MYPPPLQKNPISNPEAYFNFYTCNVCLQFDSFIYCFLFFFNLQTDARTFRPFHTPPRPSISKNRGTYLAFRSGLLTFSFFAATPDEPLGVALCPC